MYVGEWSGTIDVGYVIKCGAFTARRPARPISQKNILNEPLLRLQRSYTPSF